MLPGHRMAWHGSCTVAEVHQSLGNSGICQQTSAVTGAHKISCCNCNPRNLLLTQQGAPAASFLSSLVGVSSRFVLIKPPS